MDTFSLSLPLRIAGLMAAAVLASALAGALAGCALQRRALFPAEKLSRVHQFRGLGAGEELFLTTSDGVEINAIHFREGGSGVILYCHGNAGSLESWRHVREDLAFLGYDLLVFDYRGYGKSGGEPGETGLYEDAETAYRYLRQFGYADSQIVVFGRSIGTGVAVHLAQSKPVRALVLESPYASLRSFVYREYWFLMPWFYLAYSFDNCDKIRYVAAPKLLLHGDRDEVIPLRYGQRLADCAGAGARLVVIPGGRHNDLVLYPAWRSELARFLGTP